MKLTHSTIHALFNEGAPNSAQLHLLGLPKKPHKGWLKRQIGREITEELYYQVLALKGPKPKGAVRTEWRNGNVVF